LDETFAWAQLGNGGVMDHKGRLRELPLEFELGKRKRGREWSPRAAPFRR
jgi:hypothetical protein